jgi:hypothetical protein
MPRRLLCVFALAVLALTLGAGSASAKTLRTKLKGQPFGPYQLAPRFSASASLKTGRNATLRVSVKKHIKGSYKIQLRKARGGKQPCRTRSGKSGKGAVKRGVRGWHYQPLNIDDSGKGKASGSAKRFKPNRRSVYYVVVLRKKTPTMCGVISGHPRG